MNPEKYLSISQLKIQQMGEQKIELRLVEQADVDKLKALSRKLRSDHTLSASDAMLNQQSTGIDIALKMLGLDEEMTI